MNNLHGISNSSNQNKIPTKDTSPFKEKKAHRSRELDPIQEEAIVRQMKESLLAPPQLKLPRPKINKNRIAFFENSSAEFKEKQKKVSQQIQNSLPQSPSAKTRPLMPTRAPPKKPVIQSKPELPKRAPPKRPEPEPLSNWSSKKLTNTIQKSIPHFLTFVNALSQSDNPQIKQLAEELSTELTHLQHTVPGPINPDDFDKLITHLERYAADMHNQAEIPLFFANDFDQWIKEIRDSVHIDLKQVSTLIKNHIVRHADLMDFLKKQANPELYRSINVLTVPMTKVVDIHAKLSKAESLFAEQAKELPIHARNALKSFFSVLHQEIDRIPAPLLLNRVKMNYKIPEFSALAKLKQGLLYIIKGLGQKIFGRWYSAPPSLNPQLAPKELTAEHKSFDGRLIVKEQVTRLETVPQLIASKKAHIKSLEDQNQSHSHDKLIRTLTKEVERYERYHKNDTWVTALQLPQAYKQFSKDSNALNPTQTYVPGLVNSRIHSIQGKDKTLTVHRSGALSYLLDGTTSLPELKKLLLEKWGDPHESYEDFKMNIDQKYDKLSTLEEKLEFNGIVKAIGKRERALIDQMVQYVSNQVSAHVHELVDPTGLHLANLTRTLQITQVGLLSPTKKSQSRSGMILNEKHQMMDMAEMFQMFNGKQLQFADVDAPFYSEGTLYLPLSMVKDPLTGKPIPGATVEEPFTLACTFFNLAVQGGGKNTGAQKQVNEQALQNMENNLNVLRSYLENNPQLAKTLNIQYTQLLTQFHSIKSRLEKGESNYSVAIEILLLQIAMQGIIGANCFSGKDRTGYLIALLVDYLAAHQIDQDEEIDSAEKAALKKHIAREIIDMNEGIASKIVFENTGHRALKITERNLIGLSKDEGLSGDVLRLGYGLMAWSAVG